MNGLVTCPLARCPLEFPSMTQLDYLLIGHITCDLIPGGFMTGGTVTYSGRVAASLGYQTAVLTSCAPNFAGLTDLAGLEVVTIPAEATTTFENIYLAEERQQIIHAVANRLTVADLPAAWQHPKIVHLAPLTNEVDPAFITHFSDTLVGLTPQGWLRQWDADGRVTPTQWAAAREMLPAGDVVILSQEDLVSVDMLWDYWEWSKLLVLTNGAKGCLVIEGDKAVRVPSIPVQEVDATGAGDIFATAYLTRYHKTGDPLDAAHYANFVAAQSVTQAGIENVLERLQAVMNNYE